MSLASEEPGSLLDEPLVQFPAPKLQMGNEPPKDLELSIGSTVDSPLPLQGLLFTASLILYATKFSRFGVAF